LLRNRGDLVPVARTMRTLLVVYAPDNDVSAGSSFSAAFSRAVSSTRVVRVTPRTGAAELDSLTQLARGMERVVVYTYTRTLEGAGRFAIAPRVAQFIDALGGAGKTIVVAGGNPYVIKQFPSVAAYAVTYGRGESLETAAAQAITGQTPIGGKSPVSLPGFFSAGDGIAQAASARARP
jgi:beta-N-acetylhexosaminidase